MDKKVLNLKLGLAGAFFIVSFLWLAKALLIGFYPDFQTQYIVPKLVFSGINPYVNGNDLYTPQVYPPTAFFFFLPFSFLNFSLAPTIYTAFSIICLIATLIILSKIFNIQFFSTTYLLLSSLVFISFPTKFTLGMGQVNLLILFFVTLCLYFLQKNKKVLAGFVLGLPLAIKFMPIFLPVYFLIKKEYKTLFGIFLLVLIFLILVLIFVPKNIYLEFLNIFPSFINSWKLDYYNQALSGSIGRSFGVGGVSNILKTILTVFLVGFTFGILLFKKTKNYPMIFGILLTLNLIVNTFSWQHHFVLLIIPFFAAFFEIKKLKNNKNYFITLIISYILVSINFRDPKILPTILQSHVLYGSLMLLFLQIKLLLIKSK